MDYAEENSTKPEISEYKGRPVITLNPGERYPFTVGLSKAKLILQHIEDIKAFVEKHDQ